MKDKKIQVLRALAIMVVVLIHTCPSNEIVQIFVRPFLNIGVALFVFLSGYLTDIDRKEWKPFYKKRILRVLIPYVIWSLLYLFIKHKTGLSIKTVVYNLLTGKSAVMMYYVLVYIQLVLLTPLIGKLAKSKYKWIGWIISPLSLLIKYLWIFKICAPPHKYVNLLWNISGFNWFTVYFLGILLGNKIIKKKFDIKKLIPLWVLTVGIQIAEGYGWYLLGQTNCGTQSKVSTLLTSMVFMLIIYCYIVDKKKKGDNKLLVMIGDYSFAVYLSHIMILRFLIKIPFWSSIPFVINSAILLSISVGCAYIGNKILGEKISKWLGLC